MLSKDYGNMGTNVGYFYFGVTVAMAVLIFVFVRDAQLTLEQIDDFFLSSGKTWKTSTRKNKAISRLSSQAAHGEFEK